MAEPDRNPRTIARPAKKPLARIAWLVGLIGALGLLLATHAGAAGGATEAWTDTPLRPSLDLAVTASAPPPPDTLTHVTHGFRGSVVLVALTTADCASCDDVVNWARGVFAEYGTFGLAVVNVDAMRALDFDAAYLIAMLRANGLDASTTLADQLAAWERAGVDDDGPVLLVYSRTGRLVYAGVGPRARYQATRAVRRAFWAPERLAGPSGSAAGRGAR